MKRPMIGLMAAMLLLVAIPLSAQATGPNDRACWGQATKVFAQTGEIGEHASAQPTPRLGL